MSEATSASIANDIRAAGMEYLIELTKSGDNWETKPAASGEGEDAWCARQVAEHVGGACGFFGVGVAKMLELAPPGRTGAELPDAAAAVQHFPGALDRLLGVVTAVPDSKLGQEGDFGPLGTRSVQQIFEVAAYHFRDHANQLRALRG